MIGRRFIAIALGLVAAAVAQETGPSKAVFGGTVRDTVSGQGVGRALVRLIPPDQGDRYQTTTESSGAFQFHAVGAGAYSIEVTRSGYSDSHGVALKDGAMPAATFQIAAGDRITDAQISLEPDGTISGRVVDADGNPLEDASVFAIGERWQRGRRTYDLLSSSPTDADGTYRLTLAAGRYYVQATIPRGNGTPTTFVTEPGGQEMKIGAVIYPNAAEIEAGTALEVKPGVQVTGIDFKLRPGACYHVRGAVKAKVQPVVFLGRRGAGTSMIFESGASSIRPDGSFDIAGVQPGHYMLQSFPGTQTLTPVNVDVTDRDVNGVTIELFGRFDVSGHVQFDGDGAQPAIEINLSTVDAAQFDLGDRSGAKSDGSFVLNNLPARRFAVLVHGDPGLYVESVSVGGRTAPDGLVDLTHGAVGPLEIVVAKGTAGVEGKVRLPDAVPGKAATEATAVLVSADGTTGNTGARSAAVDLNGHFQFAAVPPGQWLVFAAPHYDEGLWQNMDFVRAMAGEGTAVSAGKSGSVQVEVSPVSMESIRRASDGVGR